MFVWRLGDAGLPAAAAENDDENDENAESAGCNPDDNR